RRVSHHRLAGNVWSREERDLEDGASCWSLVARVDQRSNLRHRARQREVVCHLSRSREREDRVAERSAALAKRPFAEREWAGVAESRNRRLECLRLFPGLRHVVVRREWQHALEGAARAVQYVLRLRRLADSRRRQSDPAGG